LTIIVGSKGDLLKRLKSTASTIYLMTFVSSVLKYGGVLCVPLSVTHPQHIIIQKYIIGTILSILNEPCQYLPSLLGTAAQAAYTTSTRTRLLQQMDCNGKLVLQPVIMTHQRLFNLHTSSTPSCGLRDSLKATSTKAARRTRRQLGEQRTAGGYQACERLAQAGSWWPTGDNSRGEPAILCHQREGP
jgi:hypothetical protein